MKHEKTFDAINKLKEVEIELHRLKNLLEITGSALDAKSEWVCLTKEDKYSIYRQCTDVFSEPNWEDFANAVEAKLKEKNT